MILYSKEVQIAELSAPLCFAILTIVLRSTGDCRVTFVFSAVLYDWHSKYTMLPLTEVKPMSSLPWEMVTLFSIQRNELS